MLYVCFSTNRSQIFFFLRFSACVLKFGAKMSSPARKNIAMLICQSAEVRKALLEAYDYAKMYLPNK